MKNVLVCFQTHFVGKYFWRDLVQCKISQSDAFDNISLFLCVYDCTDSSLTNMNEWIHEEQRAMCYVPHQKSEVLLLKKKKRKEKAPSISGTFCGAGDLFSRVKHKSLCISVKAKDSQLVHIWSLSVPTAVCFDCHSVTQQSTEFIGTTTASERVD